MLNINLATFSGEIIGIKEDDGKGILCILRQKVAMQFDTTIALFIPNSLVAGFKKKFKVKKGETILVIDGVIYEKNNVVRIKASSLSQLLLLEADAPDYNSVSFNGIVTNVDDIEGGRVLSIKQEVCSVMQTTFDVFIPASLLKNNSFEKVKQQDNILVTRGTIYTKDGMIRIRITEPTQLQEVQEDFFLGEETAKDKFI